MKLPARPSDSVHPISISAPGNIIYNRSAKTGSISIENRMRFDIDSLREINKT